MVDHFRVLDAARDRDGLSAAGVGVQCGSSQMTSFMEVYKRHERLWWCLLNAGNAASLVIAALIPNLTLRVAIVSVVGLAWAIFSYVSGYLKGMLRAADAVGEGIARLFRGP